jgi:2'-5' RNA ligase
VPDGAGTSAVVVEVPAAQTLVASTPPGMPAHVTVLYPFLDADRLDAATVAQLADVCAEVAPIDVVFEQTGCFPGVLYLAPEPAEPLRRLTKAIAARWPEAPPYGGVHEDVVPHLTVASGDDATLDDAERAIGPALPLRTRLDAAVLYVFDGERWEPRARLPFRSHAAF